MAKSKKNNNKNMKSENIILPVHKENDETGLMVKENQKSTPIEKQSDYHVMATKIDSDTWKMISGTEKETLALDIIFRAVMATSVIVPGTKDNAALVTNALQELKPQSSLEGMLGSQLISLHFLGMDYLRRAEKASMRCHQDPDLNNAVKILRLQHETIEALMKLRRNGEQRVVVQHVQVNDGGKAIVGNLINGGRGLQQKIKEVPHGHSTNL